MIVQPLSLCTGSSLRVLGRSLLAGYKFDSRPFCFFSSSSSIIIILSGMSAFAQFEIVNVVK